VPTMLSSTVLLARTAQSLQPREASPDAAGLRLSLEVKQRASPQLKAEQRKEAPPLRNVREALLVESQALPEAAWVVPQGAQPPAGPQSPAALRAAPEQLLLSVA
jgi:hypothetical protein